MARRSAGEAALGAALLLLLGVAVVYPLLTIVWGAVLDGGWPAPGRLLAVLSGPLFREALGNTLLAGALAIAVGSVLAVPVAVVWVRCSAGGRALIGALGVLPLLIPPFVAAVGWQEILGPVPVTRGLTGVVLVDGLHCFPLILLSTAAALGSHDSSLEEQARNLGASGLYLFRRVLLPPLLPGYAAGALLAFVRVIDDLGTPLLLDYPALLAPRAYTRAATMGLADAQANVACLALLGLSLGALGLARRVLAHGETAAPRRGEGPRPVALARGGRLATWAVVVLLLGPTLLPVAGLVLRSVSPAGSSPGYEVLVRSPRLIRNTLCYAGLAALADVALGGLLAWLLRRGRGRRWLAAVSILPMAIPGVVIAVGYRHMVGWAIGPGPGESLGAAWLILVAVYAVRRLPYTVRGARAALGPLSPALEQAARGLGAGRARILRLVTLPLMARGLLAGGLLAFVASAVDLSSTILLVPRPELAPLAYGFFVLARSGAGRGAAAALGLVAIVLVVAGAAAAAGLSRRSSPTLYRG